MLNNYAAFLNTLVSCVEVVLNTIAIIIVLYSVVIGFIKQYKGISTAKHVVCKGISDALNYNLATEVLKIIVSRELKDLAVIAGILILKIMITALFILEIKQDEMRDDFVEKTIKLKAKRKKRKTNNMNH